MSQYNIPEFTGNLTPQNIIDGLNQTVVQINKAIAQAYTDMGTAVITGGSINNTTIGATTPSTGKFTTLQATSLDSTPIGANTPSTGAFTTITANATAISGTPHNISNTQSVPNAGDTGDGTIAVSYTISAASATNQLVSRAFKMSFTNSLTGGGAVGNARVINLTLSTVASTSTTNMDGIYIESGGSSGTVGTVAGVHVASLPTATTSYAFLDSTGAASQFAGPVLTGNRYQLTTTISPNGTGNCVLQSATNQLALVTNSVIGLQIGANQDIIFGTAALATNATTGFPWMASCAGAPTGAPTAPYTAAAPFIFDTTNNKLWIRNTTGTPAWKGVVLA